MEKTYRDPRIKIMGQGLALRAMIVVTAGVVLGVPHPDYSRTWHVIGDVPGPDLGQATAEAISYLAELPYPSELNWVNMYAVWL